MDNADLPRVVSRAPAVPLLGTVVVLGDIGKQPTEKPGFD
jgi:hypothetical protein